mmetsp:Transcript_917/g.931  ORF Transcript_917/g.931 Transcript_917/m.931 type:complete len:150 (-) Transcript_917:78-527(-)
MTSQFAGIKERQRLNEIFKAFDKNNDGELSREELIMGYTQLYGDVDRAHKEVKHILGQIDANNSGSVDYSEFMMATLNLKTLLTTEKLKAAFDMFDQDKSGSITIDEIMAVLGGNKRPEEIEEWKQIIRDIDADGNGEISFDEFSNMMT